MKNSDKRNFYLFLLILFVSFLSSGSLIQKKDLYPTSSSSVNEDSAMAENTRLLAWYKHLYSDPGMNAPATFNQGNVSATYLSDYLTKTDNGFVIQLPGNTMVPSPVVYDGKIFVSGGFGSKQYYAFEGKNGELIRAWDLDDDGPSSAAIKDSILVFTTESCTIFAIDLRTGKQLWSWWLGDPLMSMPTIANGIVFTAYPAGSFQINTNQEFFESETEHEPYIGKNENLPDLSHKLIAFDLKTGEVLWQKWIDGDVMSAPVAYENDIYVTTFAGTLYKFRQKSGELISVSEIRATSAPAITKDGIYISKRADDQGERISEELARYNEDRIIQDGRYNKKYAPYLDKNIQGGSEMKKQSANMDAGNGFISGAPSSSGWSKANDMIGQSNVSSLQSFQGSRSLYHMGKNYSTMGDELFCSDPSTGKNIWSIKLEGDMLKEGGFMGTPPLAVGHYIIIATYTGDVLVIQAESGKVKEKYVVGNPVRYQPVIMDGWIYITTTNSKLYAINTGIAELTGWPMWGGNAERSNESMK
jgi:outer membrane protein assembly factor BamB